jgi:hypothetical protein
MKSCICPDWLPNVTFINERILESEMYVYAYNITPFRYCPYCSRKLIDMKEDLAYDGFDGFPQGEKAGD